MIARNVDLRLANDDCLDWRPLWMTPALARHDMGIILILLGLPVRLFTTGFLQSRSGPGIDDWRLSIVWIVYCLLKNEYWKDSRQSAVGSRQYAIGKKPQESGSFYSADCLLFLLAYCQLPTADWKSETEVTVEDSAHILIVDDNESLCKTMSFILKHKSYRVSIAENGSEALDKVL